MSPKPTSHTTSALRAATASAWCRVLLTMLLSCASVLAQEKPMLDAGPPRERVDPSELNPIVRAAADTLESMRDEPGKLTAEQWSVVCEACGMHPSIRGFATETKPFPAMITVGLLTHPKFAVRMGALEMLETKTNKDSAFDPWQPDSDKSQAELKKWQVWASGGKETTDTAPATIDEAKMRGYLVDIVATDVAKQERAIEALAAGGMKSVAFLEQYLHDTPQITEGTRARIKQTQYRLVLRESMPKDAARLARDLVYGTRDQKLAAMQLLPRCREKAVPILVEYLPDADGLIREASMDAIIQAGGEAVYPLVEARLKTETDENVIHAVLRRVSTESTRGAELIARFVSSPTEDLAVAALNALADGKSSAAKDRVLTCIRDPRWRVRVAALEYAGKLDLKSAGKAVTDAFADKDEFVRYAAMKAAADMKLSGAAPLISEMAMKDDSLLGPATEAIVRMGTPLPDNFVKVLPSKSGESLLGVLRAFGKRAGHDGSQIEWEKLTERQDIRYSHSRGNEEYKAAVQALEIVRTLARHRDPDVSSMAIQMLAGIMMNESDKRLVFDALNGGNEDAQIAIIESMVPGSFDFRESFAPEADSTAEDAGGKQDVFDRIVNEPPPRNAAQDAVYAAFGIKLDPPKTVATQAASQPGERTWGPLEKELFEVLGKAMAGKNEELVFHATLQLAFGGNRKAIIELRRRIPDLEPHQRVRVAAFLHRDTRFLEATAGREVLRLLLQDVSPEVRGDAVNAALRKTSTPMLQLLLEEAAKPDGQLRAVDVYQYSLSNATEQPKLRGTIHEWCAKTLTTPNARDDMRTLALVLLGTSGGRQHLAAVQATLAHPNVWQRRAAWRALLRLDREAFETGAATMAKDASPRVREVLAAAFKRSSNDAFRVWFGERDFENETAPYNNRLKVYEIPEKVLPHVIELARDADVDVKLHAMLSLLSEGRERDVDPLSLREAIAALGERDRRGMLEDFLQESFSKLSPRFGFLLDHVDRKWFSDSQWSSIVRTLSPGGQKKKADALVTFASLVAEEPSAKAPADAAAASNAKATPRVASAASVTNTKPLRVLFFYKPGCKDCERIRDMLETIHRSQPLAIDEYNIERAAGAQINQALCVRFKVEPSLQQVTPAVFMQTGALVKTAITFNALQRLVERTAEATPDESWHQVASEERQAAGGAIEQRFNSFSIGWVALAGLLDGINPCAFATIIFFLSYLQVARRSRREILLVGAAFILAVFLSYLGVGLGLSHLIAKLDAFSWLRVWLNRILALVALLLAWLSFRDGIRALRGKITESTLQLPEFLKTRIRSVIRVQAKASHFVIAAFASGIVISLLELACTGQVYLPTIVYMMNQGRLSALGYLLLYNIAFVLPLIAIFVLAWLGMTSAALIDFQKKHTATVRFATALLFLALWIVLLVA